MHRPIGVGSAVSLTEFSLGLNMVPLQYKGPPFPLAPLTEISPVTAMPNWRCRNQLGAYRVDVGRARVRLLQSRERWVAHAWSI